VRPRTAADEPAVVALLTATADRVAALDPRVRLARRPLDGDGALVAVDEAGTVHGHVRPEVHELDPDDESRMFAPDHWVSWVDAAADGPAAVDALAAALRRPGTAGADADTVLWPAADELAASWWAGAGLERAAHYAVRPPGQLPGQVPDGVAVRPVRPADTEEVLALHQDAVVFQAAVSPYVRAVPAGEAGFHRRLLEGRSSTHVAVAGGELVGACEWWVMTVDPAADDPPGLLPPGRYAYLNSVAVRFESRGAGVGRALVGAALAAAGPDLAGSTLWFNEHNPIASRVWPHLGWRPLWTSWERRAR
jgi:ribosomal protein S18 acetylase RimI-like enzyme